MLILRVCRTQTQFPEFSYRLLSVDTAYGERQENSWSAAPGMRQHRPGCKGLVEHVYEMAVNYTPVNPHPPGLFRPPAR